MAVGVDDRSRSERKNGAHPSNAIATKCRWHEIQERSTHLCFADRWSALLIAGLSSITATGGNVCLTTRNGDLLSARRAHIRAVRCLVLAKWIANKIAHFNDFEGCKSRLPLWC